MIVNERIIMAFVEDQYGSAYKVFGDEVHVASEFGNQKKTNINLTKGVVHDYYYGAGWSFPEFVKMVKEFETTEETEDYLLGLAMAELKDMRLSDIVNRKKPKLRDEDDKPKIVVPTDFPAEAKPVNMLAKTFPATRFVNYLKGRGITQEQVDTYNLRYCAEGEYSGRIIIPFIEDNRVLWFQGRAINKGVGLRYMNPTGVSKSALVYNIDRIQKRCIIVEGPFDAMMVDGQAIMGPALSRMQTAKILTRNPEEVIIIPDMDKARRPDGVFWSPGLSGAEKSIKMLKEAGYSNIKIAFNSGGKDLADIGADAAREFVETAIPWGIRAEVKMNQLKSKIKNSKG